MLRPFPDRKDITKTYIGANKAPILTIENVKYNPPEFILTYLMKPEDTLRDLEVALREQENQFYEDIINKHKGLVSRRVHMLLRTRIWYISEFNNRLFYLTFVLIHVPYSKYLLSKGK